MATSTESAHVPPTVNIPTVAETEAVKETTPPAQGPVTETVKEVSPPNPALETEGVKESQEDTAPIDNGHGSPTVEAQLPSFKEESYFVSDLKESEKKALQDLKLRVEEALKNNEFTEPPPKVPETKETPATTEPESKEDTKATESAESTVKEQEEKVAEVKESAATEAKETVKEEIKTTIEEVKVVETKTDIDVKSGGTDVRKEETEVTVTETVSVPAHGDVPKHEETVVLSQGSTESVTVTTTQAAASNETAVAENGKPVEVTVTTETEEIVMQPVENLYLWGVPLLHTMGDERTDVLLLKFLRARDFKVNEAFTMLKNTILWRKRFGADKLLEEDLGDDCKTAVYMHGVDKEGHPVCYNVYGVFQDKELYEKTFGDSEKCDRFLRWRIQLLEKEIVNQLSFKPGGVNSMVQITDLKNSPSPLLNKGLRQVTRQALAILQDNYPEFVARKIFLNVPWWYAAVNTMISPFLTQRTKSKFVYARPARVTETLFKYIAPEHVPIHYGGLSRENDTVFSPAEGGVQELIVKANEKHLLEFPATASEVGLALVWDVSVLGWDVNYGEEFVPDSENAYTIIVQKPKKIAADEVALRNSFKIGQPGKLVVTIDNTASKKKKLVVYRSKFLQQ
eukprot:TRINITY_DN11931_c0_g1_i1.p1 TRINITY_DN11931_c0_g1~~TRINITY_DN11931_c0_g1_i1.p1  ORF type:complete len:627 (+),score=124.50 TRINITY_DN11931_c0_g1_i1:359-2239(+)